MRQTIFLLGTLAAFCFSACEKTTVAPEPTAGKRLAKVITTDGVYTTTALYGYDAEGRLATLQRTETGGGITYTEGFRIVRKSGLLDRVIFATNGDSVVMSVTVGGGRYTQAEWSRKVGSYAEQRGAAFAYDADGHIREVVETDLSGGLPDAVRRTEFAYTNNSLSTVKVYRTSGGTNRFSDQYEFAYDGKTNPLPFGTEWIVLSQVIGEFYTLASPGNLSKFTVIQNSTSEAYNVAYTYNKDLPVSASTQPDDPAQSSEKITYTYE